MENILNKEVKGYIENFNYELDFKLISNTFGELDKVRF